jgi:hypoxanthine phosphoribosyltransferase
MSIIKVHDKEFKPWMEAATIQKRVQELAAQINEDYAGKKPLFIAILNGAFIFAADLFKNITIEAEISFIKLVSYKGTKSTGNVITAIGLDESLQDRHIILLEDIVDTGKTLYAFLPQLYQQQPASINICTLLTKPEALQHQLNIKYLGFSIENKFVLGYGLDYDGLGRNIPEIYQLVD